MSINAVKEIFVESGNLKLALAADVKFVTAISDGYDLIKKTILNGGTIYVCGNGGSTCDSMHLVEELVARFKKDRRGIKAMHFMDPSTLTCWGNDYDFESMFERYAATFCSAKDLLIGISTSGNSKNVLRGLKKGKELGCSTIGLLGKDGGKILKEGLDVSVVVSGSSLTERIQEAHITAIHAWCELIDRDF